jgi:hypothetical protein
MHIADRQLGHDFVTVFNRRTAQLEQLRDVERLLEPVILLDLAVASPVGSTSGWYSRFVKSRPRAFQWSIALRGSRRSERPIISSIVRKPSCAMSSRISCAMKRMKLITCSGLPSNFSRSFGSCVATPAGHVFR